MPYFSTSAGETCASGSSSFKSWRIFFYWKSVGYIINSMDLSQLFVFLLNFFYDKITVKCFMSKFTTLAVQFDETFMLALATFKTLALVIPISTFNKNTCVDNFPALKNIHQLWNKIGPLDTYLRLLLGNTTVHKPNNLKCS